MTRKKSDSAKTAAAPARKAKGAAKEAGVTANAAGADADHAAAPDLEVSGPHIVVRTKRGVSSRWRCGRNFGPEPTLIPIADLEDGAFKALETDPALVVEQRSK